MRRWYRASCAGCGARFRSVTVGRLEQRIMHHRCWATPQAAPDLRTVRGWLFKSGASTGQTWPGSG